MTDTSDYLKVIAPIFTFSLGIIFVPFIENLKDKRKAKRAKQNFNLEINDEIKTLTENIKKMVKALKDSNNFKNGTPEEGDIVKYAPRNTNLYFIGQAMELTFAELSEKQRNAIKSLSVQIEATNNYLKAIREIDVKKDSVDELIDNYKRYLYTGTCMFNTMRIIINHTKANTCDNYNNIINDVFYELNIDLKVDDIKVKKTKKIL